MSKRSEDKKWGMVTHLAALSGILFPLGLVLGPMLVWFLKRNDSNYLDVQGKRAINFQLTILIISFVITIFSVLIKPLIIFAFLAGLVGIIFAIYAAIQANKHANYNYPYALKILK